MTSIRTYDPADGTAPPELPPLPIGALAAGTAELLQQAADLPQPCFITISSTQRVALQFAPEQASLRAITRWALRFGGVVTSEPGQVYRTPFGIILAAKLAWLLGWLIRMTARHPLAASILAAAAVTWARLGWVTLAALVLAAVVLLAAWRWFRPVSFSRWVGRPARGKWRAWCYRRRWANRASPR